jgi:hypothetical protein
VQPAAGAIKGNRARGSGPAPVEALVSVVEAVAADLAPWVAGG